MAERVPPHRRPPDPAQAFHAWRAFASYSPVLPVGRIVAFGTRRALSSAGAGRAYDAPFPYVEDKAGARAFPALVPTSPSDPAVPANRAAWGARAVGQAAAHPVRGREDPILGKADRPLQRHVQGAQGQPHDRLPGGHFVQEDQGAEIARRTVAWMSATGA